MYAISSKLYHQLATRLVELVADKGYFSGKFEFEFDGVYRLRYVIMLPSVHLVSLYIKSSLHLLVSD